MTILILAAGTGARMEGRDKTLEEVGGMPFLTRLAQRAAATARRVIAVIPVGHEARRSALRGTGADIAEVGGAPSLSASLRSGAAAAGPGPLMVLLADMPGLAAADLARTIAVFEAAGGHVPVRGATPDGRAGHPVILPPRLVARLSSLVGDTGAARLVSGEDAILVPFEDDRAILDLDTPEDWAAWRASAG